MRIDALHLLAFGPFTGRSLDLSQGREGLHVVFGPNEAGKSTALRALEQFLFGIPKESSDDFIHDYRRMQIGATIRARSGELLEAVRRKGLKNTLCGAGDGAPIAEERLAAMLGGIDQTTFATMFGIDHERLLRGGEEMVTGGGEVGQTLFAAGAGLSSLQAIRQRLEKEAEGLFKPSGQNPAINKQISEWKKADKAFRDAQLPVKEWHDREEDLQKARARLEAVETELQRLRARHRSAKRLQQARRSVFQREEKMAAQARLGPVIVLPVGFSEKRVEAEKRLSQAQKEQEKAAEETARLEGELAAIVVPEGVIESQSLIEKANTDFGAYLQARSDIPKREAERSHCLSQAAGALETYRPGVSLEMAEQLRVTDAQRKDIAELGLAHQAVLQAPRQAAQKLSDAEGQLEEECEELRRLAGGEVDLGPLRDLLRRHLAVGDLEGDLARLRIDEARKIEEARADLARLGIGDGDLESFERRSVPDAPSIDHFEELWEQARSRGDQLQRERSQSEDQLLAVDRRLDELQLQGEVPTEADLAEARRIREAGWELVRAAWKDGTVPPDQLEAFLAGMGLPCDADLADAYARAVKRTDEFADRLVHEVERVHGQARLLAERNDLQRRLTGCAEKGVAAQLQREEMESRWGELWSPAGVMPRTPREMRQWHGKYRDLLQKLASLREARTAAEKLIERIQAARGELVTEMARYGEAAPENDPLLALRERCQRLEKRLAADAMRREEIAKSAARLKQQVRQAKRNLEQAESEWQSWRQLWAVAVEPLGLPPDATPTTANQALAALSRIFEWLDRAGDKQERIDRMTESCEQFERELRLLVQRLAPELGELPFEEQARRLSERLRAAQRDHELRSKLLKDLKRRQSDLKAARESAQSAGEDLDALCREANCSQPEELKEAERRSEEAKALRDARQQLEDTLHEIADGIPLETLVRDAGQCDPDAIQSDLEQTGRQIEQLEKERDELNETCGRLREMLRQLDSGMPAADAAELAGSILAELGGNVWEYVRWRLASAILRISIQRYQEQNQDPILARASDLFARLTAGSFRGLQTQYDSGKAVLAGDRTGGGDPVASTGMSEGTGYQLYLALRIASLEHYLEHREPVPLVVDDILISFDDARAGAALDVLAELSHKTQVIFFTHHRHLVEIARQRLPREVLFCHNLADGIA